MIADGPPHVRLPVGSLPLADGDLDDRKDTDADLGIHDAAVDKDIDVPIQEGMTFPDSDDRFPLDLGRGATRAEARVLAGVVSRYFAAARAGDVARVCSMLLPEAAEAFTHVADGLSSHGETCQAAAAPLLARSHRELSTPIEVVDVRVVGEAGDVVFGSKTMSASHVLLKRSGGAWRLDGLLGYPLL